MIKIESSQMKRKKLLILYFFGILLVTGALIKLFWPNNQDLYKVTILPSLGGNATSPQAINDNGQIAGFSKVEGNYHLFLWGHKNGIKDLGIVINSVISINNAGQIAANVYDPNGNQRAFIWDPNSGRTILPTLGGQSSFAFSINNKGQITGSAQTSSGLYHAFAWDDVNGIRDLTPTASLTAQALFINDAGQTAIISQGNISIVDVNKNTTITFPKISLSGIYQITDKGDILCLDQSAQGVYNIITLQPDSSQKIIFQFKAISALSKINNKQQIIISEINQRGGLFGKIFPETENINHLLDPDLGDISLDEYSPSARLENLTLTEINNKGWIIGEIRSTIESSRRGVLFEPIPDKMQKMINKSGARK